MDVRQPNREQPKAAPVNNVTTPPRPVRRDSRWLLPFAAGILVSVLIAFGAALWHQKQDNTSGDVDTSKYQAVFMTNGQVYFGKLAEVNGIYSELTDVYYLQVQQSVQPANNDKKSQVSLTKLGSELHGPTDKMHISRDQILFWENLTDDSTVVKAINQYQADK